MGSVFKKTVTHPVPANATITTRRRRATARELSRNPGEGTVVERIAKWRNRKGELKTGVVFRPSEGSERVRVKSETYYAKYRDAGRIVREIPTGCRDRDAARTKLTELERTADKVRAGVFTAAECKAVENRQTPIAAHVDDYKQTMRAAGVSSRHIDDTARLANRLIRECEITYLRDVTGEVVERWLVDKQKPVSKKKLGLSARTRNSYLQALNGFCNWCVECGRLLTNPLARIKRADETLDCRRQRRALTEKELRTLLYVARWRPLAEYGRETVRNDPDKQPTNAKSRKTWKMKPLALVDIPAAIDRARAKLKDNPAFVDELERRGIERSLVYKLAVLTGLRRGEIESLTFGHLELDAHRPIVRMRPIDTKNNEAAEIPLRSDLAGDLRKWTEAKRMRLRGQIGDVATPTVANPIGVEQLPQNEPMFLVPRQFVKTLDRDLLAAGIDKVDERKRTIDFHALRHSFGTLLSKGGVAPRTAQQAMRHSNINLTMNTYTDPKLLDIAGAMESLPSLPLDDSMTPPGRDTQRATVRTLSREHSAYG